MNPNEYVFKYEYEKRKEELETLLFTKNERMTPIKKRWWFNVFIRKKQ